MTGWLRFLLLVYLSGFANVFGIMLGTALGLFVEDGLSFWSVATFLLFLVISVLVAMVWFAVVPALLWSTWREKR